MSRELVIHRHYTANGCSNSLQIICFIRLYNLPIKIFPSLSKIISVPLSLSLHNWLKKNTFIGSLFLNLLQVWMLCYRGPLIWQSISLLHTWNLRSVSSPHPHCVSAPQLRLPSETDPWSHCKVCSLPVCSSWQVHSHDNTMHTQLTS